MSDEAYPIIVNPNPPKNHHRRRLSPPKIFLITLIIVVITGVSSLLATRPSLFSLFNKDKIETGWIGKEEPLTTTKVDTKTQSGEFVINTSPSIPSQEDMQSQVIIEGIYNPKNREITIEAHTELSQIPLPHVLPSQKQEELWLEVEIVSNGESVYRTAFPIKENKKDDLISFRTRLPFYKDFILNIYSNNSELLFTKKITL